jgi:hypothetical protein
MKINRDITINEGLVKADAFFMYSKHYLKKPIPIHAVPIYHPFSVETLEGTMKGKSGDYLVEGIKGEIYICDKEIFEESYEEVKA